MSAEQQPPSRSVREHVLGWRPLRSILQVLFLLGSIPAAFAFASFAHAETPGEVRAAGRHIPEEWSAGVSNHGLYYEWYTVEDAPILFGASIVYLVAAAGYLAWLGWRGSLGLS